MLNIFFGSLVSSIIFISYGTLFSLFFLKKKISHLDPCISGLNGFIVIGFLSLFLNFFFPINKIVGTILLLISVIIFMYYLSFKNRNKKLIFLIIILSISTFIIVTLSNINRPDAGLYHLPYISILQENKIIIGLTNLHYRFGHTSIFQYISATHNNYIFKKEFLNIPLASLMSFFIYFLFKNLQKFLKKNDEIKITSILFIFIFSLYSFNRYGNYGNDAPTNIFFLILIIYLLKIENFKTLKIEKFYQISILSIFLITLKPFMILVSILPLTLFFITSNKKKIIKNKNFITCLFLLSIWFIKNILISGCFVFPIKETCIKNLNIYNENITSTASNEAEAWAKGFPDSDKKLDFNTYNSKFNWVGAWYDNHFKKIVEKILPLIVLLTLFFIKNFFQKSFYRSLNLKNILENKKILFIMLFSFCYCIIWFIKFPVYRFGLSFIACFFILTFVCFLNLKNIQIYNKKFYLIITIFGLIGFYGKNLDRIIEKRNIIYNNYPWPKIYSMSDSEENLQKQFLKILDSKNNLVFYYSGGQECMYSKSPCSNYKNENLKIKRIYNYIIYYI
tara:strand:- start:17551 stop:19242 length:1692 start_codon:yes stop_codon:yes gene_type:complete